MISVHFQIKQNHMISVWLESPLPPSIFHMSKSSKSSKRSAKYLVQEVEWVSSKSRRGAQSRKEKTVTRPPSPSTHSPSTHINQTSTVPSHFNEDGDVSMNYDPTPPRRASRKTKVSNQWPYAVSCLSLDSHRMISWGIGCPSEINISMKCSQSRLSCQIQDVQLVVYRIQRSDALIALEVLHFAKSASSHLTSPSHFIEFRPGMANVSPSPRCLMKGLGWILDMEDNPAPSPSIRVTIGKM